MNVSIPNEVDVNTTVGEPHTFGWLRRSDLEDTPGQVWESPNGTLMKFPPGRYPLLVCYAGMPKLMDTL